MQRDVRVRPALSWSQITWAVAMLTMACDAESAPNMAALNDSATPPGLLPPPVQPGAAPPTTVPSPGAPGVNGIGSVQTVPGMAVPPVGQPGAVPPDTPQPPSGMLPGQTPIDSAAPQAPHEDPNDRWISYGNGPRSWFANLSETRLTPESAAGLTLKWKLDSEVTAPPVVVGSRVWVSTGHDGLYALNLEDGKVIWHEPSVSSFSGPAYDPQSGTIYVNRWEGGVLHAFDAEDGTLLWSSPISDQQAVRGWSSPVISGDRLIVGIASSDRGTTFKGGLAAFDLSLGKRLWTYTHAEPQAAGVAIWGGASIDPDGNMTFAGSGNNYSLAGSHSDSLFGVDMGAGELMWNQQTYANDRWAYDCVLCGPDNDFGANPVLFEHGGRELLAAGQKSGSFWLLDRETGDIVWERKVSATNHPAYGGILNNGAFDGTRLIVAGNDGSSPGTLMALDPDPAAMGRVLWERSLKGLVLAPITVTQKLAFVPVGKTLEIVNSETGDTVTRLDADAQVAGAAAVAHGYVFFGTGVSYYDNGAEPGSFYAFALPTSPTGITGADDPSQDSNSPANQDTPLAPLDLANPTFSAVFDHVIKGTGCNGGPLCHGGSVGMLEMNERDATYLALVNVPAMGTNLADTATAECAATGLMRVAPGDPDASLLMQKVSPPANGVPCGAIMPPTGMLSAEHIQLLRAWIAAGAPNN